MNWNYRIIEHDGSKSVYFAVHEVYYDDNGKITNWTEDPIDVTGDNVEEIVSTLQQMLSDIKHSVLKESELEKQLTKK